MAIATAADISKLVSELSRLQHENAELHDQVKSLTLPDGMTWGELTDATFVSLKIKRLSDKLAAAEADTKRLDWLEQRKYACIGINYHESQWVYQIETDGYAERGKTLRSALDAARGDKGE